MDEKGADGGAGGSERDRVAEGYRERQAAFWDAPDLFDAKFRRVLTKSGEVPAGTDKEAERLWEEATSDTALEPLLRGIPWKREWRVLEIGCGVGRLLKTAAGRFREVVGVDISPKMIEYAREYLAGFANVSVHVNDGAALPMIGAGTVDLCFSVLVFQHIPSVAVARSYFREVARVLGPGGYFRVQVCRHTLSKRLKGLLWRLLGRPGRAPRGAFHEWSPDEGAGFRGNFYRPADLRRLLEEAGLSVETIESGLGGRSMLWATARRPGGAGA